MTNTRYRIHKVSLKIIEKLKKVFSEKIDSADLMGGGDCYRVWVV